MAQFFRRMKFLDTIYYSIYRFGRSIRQPETQADACATIVLPSFLYVVGWGFYIALACRCPSLWYPPRSFKPVFLGILVFLFVLSSFVFGARRKATLSEYGKLTNQRLYIWLGAIFSAVTVSWPVWTWFMLVGLWNR